jgi:hypothetical protein
MSDSNPFATRFTRPGAIEFLFPSGQSAESLVAALRDHGWRGEIIGPHGSGKSTLLATLEPVLQAAGRKITRLVISKEPSDRPDVVLPEAAYERVASTTLDSSSQLILDGFEQLSWWSRRQIESLCRQQRAGLLITAHHSVGLPTVFHTEPSGELAQQIVSRLLPAGNPTITPADVQTAYTASGGNLRETLFALFDVYQSRHVVNRESSRNR